MSTTVLVTGGNRGFGKALVEAYLSVPNTTVIATVRDAAKAASLSSVPKAAGSNLLTITMDMGAPDSIAAGMATLPTTHNISALDVVIANAGINGPTPSLSHTPVPEIQKYIDVNAYGPFEVYKAALPLMKASAAGGKKPKFFYVSSAAGCMTGMMNFLPIAAYGASKVLGNFLFKWLSLDNKDVITVSYDPGTIDTDMTRDGLELAKQFGLQPQMGGISFAPADEVARTMKKVIDDANESTSGKFLDRDGKELPY